MFDYEVKKKKNKTGLPDDLKSGIENLSGYSMDDVQVHRNSTKPAGMNALAFAQGRDIHLAPGQEKHLPHEAWHVVQQKQGRVQTTAQMKGKVSLNDDLSLENEADLMGAKAATFSGASLREQPMQRQVATGTVQRVGFKTMLDVAELALAFHDLYEAEGNVESALAMGRIVAALNSLTFEGEMVQMAADIRGTIEELLALYQAENGTERAIAAGDILGRVGLLLLGYLGLDTDTPDAALQAYQLIREVYEKLTGSSKKDEGGDKKGGGGKTDDAGNSGGGGAISV